jgi:hypothetical protein
MWKWILSLLVCRGKHQCIMHFLGKEKVWECSRCGRVFPILESLTRASGSFTPEARKRAREILQGKQGRPTKVEDINQFKTRKKRA